MRIRFVEPGWPNGTPAATTIGHSSVAKPSACAASIAISTMFSMPVASAATRERTPHASVSRRAISARGVRLRIAVLGRSRDRRIAVAPDAVYVTATPSRSVSDTT